MSKIVLIRRITGRTIKRVLKSRINPEWTGQRREFNAHTSYPSVSCLLCPPSVSSWIRVQFLYANLLITHPQRIGPSLLSAVPTIRGDSRNANGLAPTKNGEGTLEKQVENLTSASRSRRVRLSRSSCRLPGCTHGKIGLLAYNSREF